MLLTTRLSSGKLVVKLTQLALKTGELSDTKAVVRPLKGKR